MHTISSLIHRYTYRSIYVVGDMGGIWGDMEPMERAGTLGPTCRHRGRALHGASPPPPSPTIYIFVFPSHLQLLDAIHTLFTSF